MYKRILVPVDGSDTSALGLSESIRLCADQKAELRLMHVVNELIASRGLDGAANYPGNIIELSRGAGENILKMA